jgi:hypothetical protein
MPVISKKFPYTLSQCQWRESNPQPQDDGSSVQPLFLPEHNQIWDGTHNLVPRLSCEVTQPITTK